MVTFLYSDARFLNPPLDHFNEITIPDKPVFQTKRVPPPMISHNTDDPENYSAIEPLFVDYDYGMAIPRKRVYYPMPKFRKRGETHSIDDFFNY